MQKDKDKADATPSAKTSRQDRLKIALRENLKRRKSQARGRSDAGGPSSAGAQASLDDGDNEASD